MKAVHVLVGSSALAAVAWGAFACAPSGFANEATIASVRILASSATEPYAKPGDTVTVQVLAYDGRPSKPAAMGLWWLPIKCVNPEDDAYYACFGQFVGPGADAGRNAGASSDAGAGAAAGFVAGQDLTPLLIAGPSMTVTIPPDIITSHAPVAGTAPYGLVILFNFACAGHLEYVPPDPSNANPQQIPIGCFDSQENVLGPNDFVFGFTRIYASETITDVNPAITHVDAPGGALPVDQGVTSALSVAKCSGSSKCPQIPIGPVIDAPVAGREVWADFFSTAGQFNSSARLLYGATTGSVGPPSATDTQFQAPPDAGAQLIWIVVHDDHNGASWVTVPVSVQ
jgi:hypothetical protein